MNSKFLRRAASLAVSGLMITSLMAGCNNESKNPDKTADPTQPPVSTDAGQSAKKPEDFTGTLVVGHFNDDEASKLVAAFKEKYPNVDVKLEITADTDGAYQTLITSALRSGQNVPDVYASEVAFVKRFVNLSDGYEDLTPYFEGDLKSKLVPYTIDIGTSDDGKIRALSHQAAAAAVGYKRDMAKQYLGTDDPEEIGKLFSSADEIVKTGKKLQEVSGKKAILFPGMAELMRMYLGARDHAWVEDGKLTIDPKMEEFVDVAKQLRDAGAEGGLPAWEPQWSAAITDDIHFAYAIPTWGVPWIIDANQPEDRKNKGDWGLAKAPAPYTWGGTWFGMYSKSPNKELAWEFIKFITLDEEQSIAWAKKSGDFISNLAAIETLSNDPEMVSKTTNQNPYEFFGPMIKDINGAIITEHDDKITNAFQDAMLTYLAGNTTKDQMWAQFKDQVRSDLGDKVTVE